MATRAGFQRLATNLIDKTFADFRDPVILEQVSFDNATEVTSTIASDITQGIRLEYMKGQFEGQQIQVGDYKVILKQQGLTVDIRSDDVKMTFNGKAVNIVRVSEDAARAAYTLQVRDK